MAKLNRDERDARVSEVAQQARSIGLVLVPLSARTYMLLALTGAETVTPMQYHNDHSEFVVGSGRECVRGTLGKIYGYLSDAAKRGAFTAQNVGE